MSNDEHPKAKFVRLQNGDDILSEIVEMEDEQGIIYTLIRPLKVVYLPLETTGYLSVAFMPWVFPRICDQQEFTIHAEDVMLIAEITDKMNNYYWDNLDHFTSSVKVEEDTVNHEREQQQEEYEALQKVLESIGLDKKKVYH
jgi:hypothetical protein